MDLGFGGYELVPRALGGDKPDLIKMWALDRGLEWDGMGLWVNAEAVGRVSTILGMLAFPTPVNRFSSSPKTSTIHLVAPPDIVITCGSYN
jgi:hypothetical protein